MDYRSRTGGYDEHSRKMCRFDSQRAAERFAFENHLDTCIAHPDSRGPSGGWVLVLWNPQTACECGIIDAKTCCTMPDW